MASTAATISPRLPLGDLERQARARVERDGIYVVAAATRAGRQVAYLRRLRRRLEADPGLDCFERDLPDGTTLLSVIARGQRPGGWWGEPKTG
jgi:hypothetical protein